MNWTEALKAKLAEKEDGGLKEKDLRFYQLDTFFDMAKHTERFGEKCPVCRQNKPIIMEVAENLEEYMGGTSAGRSAYDKKFVAIEKHLKKDHALVTPKYTLSVTFFLGMIFGILLGAVLAFSINAVFLKEFVLGGWLVGLIVGWVVGSRKENEIKAQGRYL